MMKVFVDWLQFTFKPSLENDDIKVQEVIEQLLMIDSSKFKNCKGMYGYLSGLEYNNIKVFYEGKIDMGFNIQISGKGCRYIESIEGFSWDRLFAVILGFQCHVSRIDIAIDDNAYLDLQKIEWYINRGLFTSRFKSLQVIEDKHIKTGDILGKTIYLGKRVSDLFIRIYQQDYKKDENLKGVRLETVMRDQRANQFINEYMKAENFGNLSFLINKVLNNYIRFIKKTDNSNNARCETADWWKEFIQTAEKCSLGKGKGVLTLDKVSDWLEKQVASSMKLIVETKGDWYLRRMVDKAVLSEQQKRIKQEYMSKVANE